MDIFYNFISSVHSLLVEYTVLKPLLCGLEKNSCILEIGGGYNPRFNKDVYHNSYHLDHCDTDSLRAKYLQDSAVSHLVDQIQPVDFVYDGSPIESLIPQELRFDFIYSSHAIEHQVDFVGHLRSLEQILKPQGRIILVIPDLRACFDRFRFPTVTSDVLVVYRRTLAIHQGKQVFDALAQGADINPGRLITPNEVRHAAFYHPLETAFDAMCSAELECGNYTDIHAWTFTPVSFRLLMVELFLLDLINLQVVTLTSVYGNQFCAVLERVLPDEKERVKRSYHAKRLQLTRRLYKTIAG